MQPSEKGAPARVPHDTETRTSAGGGLLDSFLATVYVDDFLLVRVQQELSDQAALIASASLLPDHVRLFGPGGKGEISIPPPPPKDELVYDRRCARVHDYHPHHDNIDHARKRSSAQRFVGERMAERTGQSQRSGGTKPCRKTM